MLALNFLRQDMIRCKDAASSTANKNTICIKCLCYTLLLGATDNSITGPQFIWGEIRTQNVTLVAVTPITVNRVMCHVYVCVFYGRLKCCKNSVPSFVFLNQSADSWDAKNLMFLTNFYPQFYFCENNFYSFHLIFLRDK